MTPTEFKAIRLSLGLTQADLAQWMGVTKSAISLWEGGKRAVPGPAVKLMEILQDSEGRILAMEWNRL